MLGPSLIAGVTNQPVFWLGAWRRVALGLGCLMIAAAGCVRVPVEPDRKNVVETLLFTTTANGQTSLSWTSRSDLAYTLLVAERWDAMRWQPLPACVNQPGTGRIMQYTLKEDPGRPRIYKLMATPLAKRPR
ncbi:MAG: hypothetical protein NTV49_12055 [Kiritimatiellaeota bacterium]|nr:hypothetical protein [Kiritimatiellota bacterium]